MVKKFIQQLAFALLAVLTSTAAHAEERKFTSGQVWEFEAEGLKPGALLVIQQVDAADSENTPLDIYHISIVAEVIRGVPDQLQIAHLPVSEATLDQSVTKRSDVKLVFAGWLQGWDQWRRANGGVFTAPLTLILKQLVDLPSVEESQDQAPFEPSAS